MLVLFEKKKKKSISVCQNSYMISGFKNKLVKKPTTPRFSTECRGARDSYFSAVPSSMDYHIILPVRSHEQWKCDLFAS